jgi:hypothetical protein
MHEDFGFYFRRSHQSTDWEFRLKVSWCGEPLSSATWKAPVSTKGWLKSPTGNRGGLMFSSPDEAVHKKAAKSAQRVVFNYSATLTEDIRDFPQLQGKCKSSLNVAQPASSSQGMFQSMFVRQQSQRPSANAIPPFLCSTPRPPSNKSPLNIKKTLLDGSPSPAAIALSLNTSRSSAKTSNPLVQLHPQL